MNDKELSKTAKAMSEAFDKDLVFNDTDLTNEQITAIAKYFKIEPEEIEQLDYDVYDLKVLEIDGCEYVIGDYDECEKAAKESIKDLFEEIPTAFSPWVLCDNCPNEISLESIEDLIKADMNEVIKELVNIKGLIEDCIGYDGIAHFLATYDDEEIEIEDLYLYRIG